MDGIRSRIRQWDIDFGRKIRKHRKARGATLEQVAAAIGVSYQQVQKYEKGINRVSIGTAMAMIDFLQVDVGSILEQNEIEGRFTELLNEFQELTEQILRKS